MGTPEKPKPRVNPLFEEEDFQLAAKPVQAPVVPEYVAKHLRAAEEKVVRAEKEVSPPLRWPMVSGIFLFPFSLKAMELLIFGTFGLMLSGWLMMVWIAFCGIGIAPIIYVGLGACFATILTLGYIITCCLTIIQATADGWESFQISPGLDWKEWLWNFGHMGTLVLEAGMVGAVAQFICSMESWLPMLVVTYAAFPLVLLGALAANGAWAPLAIGSVLRSLIQVPWAWGLFYLLTTLPVVGWCIILVKGFSGYQPFLTPLYAAPLLMIVILFYARLIGRLAGCISASTKRNLS